MSRSDGPTRVRSASWQLRQPLERSTSDPCAATVAAAAARAIRSARRTVFMALVYIQPISLERRERRVLEDVLERGVEDHARRLAGFPGLDPAQHMQAPAVAVLEAAEAHLRPRRDEVVAPRDAELQELVGDLHAHEVGDAVLVLRRAAAVAEVTGERRIAARAQLAAEDVLLRLHTEAMCRFTISASLSITVTRCGLSSSPMNSAGRSGSRPNASRIVSANFTGSAVSRHRSGTPGSRCARPMRTPSAVWGSIITPYFV